jgi:hypothetical protein
MMVLVTFLRHLTGETNTQRTAILEKAPVFRDVTPYRLVNSQTSRRNARWQLFTRRNGVNIPEDSNAHVGSIHEKNLFHAYCTPQIPRAGNRYFSLGRNKHMLG